MADIFQQILEVSEDESDDISQLSDNNELTREDLDNILFPALNIPDVLPEGVANFIFVQIYQFAMRCKNITDIQHLIRVLYTTHQYLIGVFMEGLIDRDIDGNPVGSIGKLDWNIMVEPAFRHKSEFLITIMTGLFVSLEKVINRSVSNAQPQRLLAYNILDKITNIMIGQLGRLAAAQSLYLLNIKEMPNYRFIVPKNYVCDACKSGGDAIAASCYPNRCAKSIGCYVERKRKHDIVAVIVVDADTDADADADADGDTGADADVDADVDADAEKYAKLI